jgi:2-amino-4-hydroxy-6-hydroxymethyldihydropteridine diphosphokinase
VPQDDYLNAVLVVSDPDATARDWLQRGFAAERAAGRERDVRWGPRTLDVDVVAVDDVRSDEPELTLPHPRAHERAFVLVPWHDVQPDAQLRGAPIEQWLRQLPADEVDGVRPRPDVEVR